MQQRFNVHENRLQSGLLQGEWSRLDLMRDPHTFGQAAIRGFVASLPVRAHSIYFKDAIGNISTSQVKYGPQSTELIITPRYPLYGGWQTEFVLGYSIPLQARSLPQTRSFWKP